MAVNREDLKKRIGARTAADLDSTVDFKLTFRPPDWQLASIHPSVVLTDSLARVQDKVAALAADGHPVLAAEIRSTAASGEAFARSVEGALIAARTLAHFTGGRTLDMHGCGAAVPAAAAAFALERGYFDGFYPVDPPAVQPDGLDWKALVDAK